MDDLRISHIDPDVVTSVIDSLSEKYDGMMPLSIHCGKVHDYLGMVFDFNMEKRVKITM